MKINEPIITEFVKSTKQEPFKETLSLIFDYINIAMANITSRNKLITDYNLLLANELFTGTEIPKSNIDIFLELNAVSLELNYKKNNEGEIKGRVVDFFKKFATNFKLSSKKEKKLKKVEKKLKKDEQRILESDTYDVALFYKDLQLQLAKCAYKSTKICLGKNKITIYGKDEFPIKINVYPIFLTGTKATLYNIKNKKEVQIAFFERFENVDAMNNLTKNLYKLQVRIFNNLYWNTFNSVPNQILIESLLYNVPLSIYTYNLYETTVGIINYLKNSTLQEFVSICNTDIKLFDEKLNTATFENAYKFINSIKIE